MLGGNYLKKIITFLGTNDYKETKYSYLNRITGEEISVTTRFVQEAIHKIVANDSTFYVALTSGAKEANWLDTAEKKGLKSIFDSKCIRYEEISLKDGRDEKEIWENFDAIFEVLEDGDHIYVDITHSFRSIPIIIMSVINYAKFIRNITIEAIYYGAYEAMVDGIAPIFDLSLFNTITDWTIGAEKFINTGNSEQISKILRETINPILRDTKGKDEEANLSRRINNNLEVFSNALYTVRGNEIYELGCQLKSSLELIKEIQEKQLKPFEKILDKIYGKVSFYSGDIVRDVHNTVKLCRDLNLIQQAYTLLLENIISYLCIAGNLDPFNRENREAISKIIPCYIPRKNISVDSKYEDINHKIKYYLNQDIASLYEDLGDYRNDMNHAGYRQNSRKAKKFKDDLNEYIDKFEKLIIEKTI